VIVFSLVECYTAPQCWPQTDAAKSQKTIGMLNFRSARIWRYGQVA